MKHFNYSETHALVSLNFSLNDKWWDTPGICPWRLCLCIFSQWNDPSRKNNRNCHFHSPMFCSSPICSCFYSSEMRKTIFKTFTQVFSIEWQQRGRVTCTF